MLYQSVYYTEIMYIIPNGILYGLETLVYYTAVYYTRTSEPEMAVYYTKNLRKKILEIYLTTTLICVIVSPSNKQQHNTQRSGKHEN